MTSLPQSQSTAGERTSDLTRWAQLVVGIICMVMIANLQYGWTLFTIPIKDTFGWSLASIQVAFTLFVLFETWLVPAEGYLVDRFGPRIVVLAGPASTHQYRNLVPSRLSASGSIAARWAMARRLPSSRFNT
jgi:OFA family oxalate/formate antiporter-like MFS transporter